MHSSLKKIPLVLAAILQFMTANADENTYNELWRPQYHFTPAHRWIGDPCGLVHFNGKFHAYSWGAAESEDLLHWTEINDNAIKGLPEKTAPFTGSVVVDRHDSAGYGKDAFIAAFTSFDEQSKKQSQSIAFSLDEGRTFRYYDLNPVIDIWSTEFRDPTVIRDEKNSRWIMLVAKALEKKVSFYGSSDLKHWEWLSDFGPAGDSEKSWECPDMFRLPVDGNPDEMKWVLLVSVNWSREQYFVGEFDGTKFIPDDMNRPPQYVDAGLDYYASRTFQDYDHTLPETYSIGWVSTWDYAQHVPTTYGKGVWSLPRALKLKMTDNGPVLCQQPYGPAKELRGKVYGFNKKLRPGVTPLKEMSGMDNSYEICMTVDTGTDNTVGLNICAGQGHKVVLTYDTQSHTLLLDRTNSTETDIPKFSRIAYSKVEPADGKIELNIFVDKSLIEIFANGGETVMTALAFPDATDNNVELFALNPGTKVEFKAYPMKSVWQKGLD